MSTFTDRADRVEYLQVDIGEAEIETAPLFSVEHREPRFFPPRPYSTWWWEAGPVEESFWCLSLPNGIALIAFFQLLGGAFDFLSVKILLDYQQLVIEEKEKYANECEGGAESNSNECLTLSQRVSEAEKITGIIPAIISYSLIDGFALMFFALVGFRAMRTGNANTAKLYLKLYPILYVRLLVLVVFKAFEGPSMLGFLVLNSCRNLFTTTYHLKVAWSFYKRRAAAEYRRLEASSLSRV